MLCDEQQLSLIIIQNYNQWDSIIRCAHCVPGQAFMMTVYLVRSEGFSGH